jgi:hypothetical protein
MPSSTRMADGLGGLPIVYPPNIGNGIVIGLGRLWFWKGRVDICTTLPSQSLHNRAAAYLSSHLSVESLMT